MSTETEPIVPPKTILVLGPCLDNVIEPFPLAEAGVNLPFIGRRQILFATMPTTPGGNVHLVIQPPLVATDVLPINVYAFFVQPVASIPPVAERTPEWFFKSGSPSASIHIGAALADGSLTLNVPNVKPSLEPHFVQTVFEFPVA